VFPTNQHAVVFSNFTNEKPHLKPKKYEHNFNIEFVITASKMRSFKGLYKKDKNFNSSHLIQKKTDL